MSDGSLPASGKPSRIPSAGAASASSSAVAAMANSQGRRWTVWLHLAAGDSRFPSVFSVRPRKGIRRRSTRGPRYARSDGSSETDASITTSTASEAEMATPYM